MARKRPGTALAREAILPTAVYSRSEAARLLHIRPDSLTALIRSGEITARHHGNRYLILGEALIAWLRKGPAATAP
jgi:excisionase family DNA binding protein